MPGRRHRWRGGHASRGTWFLEPILLLLLHRGPAHGYTLVEQLTEFGVQDLHPSAAYRTLRDMEEGGWLTSSWEPDESQGPPRRIYRLTALGDEILQDSIQDLKQMHDQIGDLVHAYHRHMEQGNGEHH